MDKFLETGSPPKMNQEELDKFEQIPRSEIEFVLIIIKKKKNLPANKVQDQMASTGNSTKHRRNLHWFFSNSSKRLKRREYSQLFHEATITLIPKPDKDPTKKENCRAISLINIDAKILSKILANQIQQYTEKIIHHDQVGFIPGSKGCFNICNPILSNTIWTEGKTKTSWSSQWCRKSIW